MTTSKIQKEIEQLQKVIDDPKTSADIKKSLTAALENAKKHLAGAAAAPAKSAKKVLHTHGSEKSLKDCQDIIEKYKKQKSTEKKRVEKRVAAGKPAELTVPETIKKAAKSVKKKVEEKPLAKTDFNASLKKIVEMVKAVQEGLFNDSERFAFADRLIEEIKKLRFPEKAARGMHVAGAGGSSHQINVYGYKTENFGAAQKEYFESLMANPYVEAHAKADVVSMARDMDDMMGILDSAKREGTIGEGGFMFAARHALRAMYYAYPVVNNADVDVYPAFLAMNLSELAVWVNAGAGRADVGLQVAAASPHRRFGAGGVLSAGDKVTIDTDALKALHPYMNNGGAKLMYNKLVEHGNDVGQVSSISDDAIAEVKWNDNETEKVPAFLLTRLPKQAMAAGGAVAFSGQPSPGGHFHFVDEGYDQTMLEKGGKVNQYYEVKSVSGLIHQTNGPTGEPFFQCKVTLKHKDFKGKAFLCTFTESSDSKKMVDVPSCRVTNINNLRENEVGDGFAHALNVYFAKKLTGDQSLYSIAEYKEGGKIDKKMFGGQINVAAPNNLEMKDNGGDQFLAPSTMKKGGEVTFKDKENAIAKSLIGKEVPAKFRDRYGKRYGKKSAHEAAKNIAGALVRNERAGKAVKKSRKMFGGLVNVAAPNNLEMKDNNGEQFLAPSV